MKKLVWAETMVKGGEKSIHLTQAPVSSGTFQNIPLNDGLTNKEEAMPTFYKLKVKK